MRRSLYTLVLVLTVVVALGPAVAQDPQPNGTVKLQSGWITPGVGWTWGTGAILFQGKENRFKVEGLTIETLGQVVWDTAGEVYNLKSLEQFPGTYTASTEGRTVGGGSLMRLKNQNDVELILKTRSQGINFQTAVDGVKIKLD